MTWKQFRERLQRVEALRNQPTWQTYLEIWCDLPWVLQASYLEGGPLMWKLPLYLHVYQKSEDDDDGGDDDDDDDGDDDDDDDIMQKGL